LREVTAPEPDEAGHARAGTGRPRARAVRAAREGASERAPNGVARDAAHQREAHVGGYEVARDEAPHRLPRHPADARHRATHGMPETVAEAARPGVRVPVLGRVLLAAP